MAFNLRVGLTPQRRKEDAAGFTKEVSKDIPNKPNLNGKKVCITGTIPGRTRATAITELKEKYPNMIWHVCVLSDTDYVMTGFGVGQKKLAEAAKRGIPTIEATRYFK